jgi:CYTH domain-containing protein
LPAYSSNASSPLAVSYVSNGAYLDLYTGALFDLAHGISLGYCVNLDDWLAILNNLCVSVVTKTNLKVSKAGGSMFALQYRSAQTVNLEVAQLEVDQKAQEQTQDFAKSVPSLSGVAS